ncbi:hypothetical protein TWF694_010239 [Orbilia ellipsospora]|uniref:Uncharacterized protein n=1 Tax=Orbilia ellipsospora TaxID=2528407 RepID=A0AAV9XAG4_9PEZI
MIEFMATFGDKARPYLDVEDRKKSVLDLQPEAKRDSYALLAGIFHRSTPGPTDVDWYFFGFVTCRGRGEVGMLLDIYQLLLAENDGSDYYKVEKRDPTLPVSFEDFWKAHEAGTLIQLMDSNGLTERRSKLPLLVEFLSVSPKSRPSVWNLNVFLTVNDPVKYAPVPSVQADYGLVNCKNLEEICILMEIYQRALNIVDPLALHRACIAGELFQFCSQYVPLKKCWRPLVKNSYPLPKDDS